ncbi:MAG: hypothetical protein U1E17_13350 [Geminicoccaceae bacterium]
MIRLSHAALVVALLTAGPAFATTAGTAPAILDAASGVGSTLAGADVACIPSSLGADRSLELTATRGDLDRNGKAAPCAAGSQSPVVVGFFFF